MPLSHQPQTEPQNILILLQLSALKVVEDVQKILQRFRENVINDFSTELKKIEQ